MKKRILSAILAAAMLISMCNFAMAAEGDVVYTFLKSSVDLADTSAWNEGLANGSVNRVVGYGAHGWKFYGYGTASKAAYDDNAYNYMGNLGNSSFTIRSFHDGVDDSGVVAGTEFYTAPQGAILALSIEAAPSAGYYKAVAWDKNDTPIGGSGAKAYLGKELAETDELVLPNTAVDKERVNRILNERIELVEGYVDAAYELSADGSVVYSDGSSPLILTFHVPEGIEKVDVKKLVLTPIVIDENSVTINTESVTLPAVGSTATIVANVNGAPLLGGFVDFYAVDEEIATVSPAGVITATGKGTTTIEAVVGDEYFEVTVTVGGGSTPVDPPVQDDADSVATVTPGSTTQSATAAIVNTLAAATDKTTPNVTKSATKNGDTYTVTTDATAGDYQFLYWVKGLEINTSKKIVSFDASFEYAPQVGRNILIAVYGKAGTTAAAKE